VLPALPCDESGVGKQGVPLSQIRHHLSIQGCLHCRPHEWATTRSLSCRTQAHVPAALTLSRQGTMALKYTPAPTLSATPEQQRGVCMSLSIT
jgi:hypothetical protein